MTSVPLLVDELDHELPALLAAVSVIALVPATELRGWAAEAAWRVARAAARRGRRTALVDCFVDEPTLHMVTGAQNNEGITDVFEYGASLNRIVQAQPQANLFFVAAGTYAADAQPLVTNPRWRRLSAGFRHEEALLLLYVAAEHVGTLAAEPDGMIVLSPIGLDTTVADAPAVAQAIATGLPIIAVVADHDSLRARQRQSSEQRVQSELAAAASSFELPRTRSRIPWTVLALVLAGLAALIYLVFFLVLRTPTGTPT